MKICCICGGTQRHLATEKILMKYDVQYFQCINCGLIQTEDPFWIDEAYSESIASADTGIMRRNLSISLRLAVIIFVKFNGLNKFIDLAGGYGVLARLMRDFGYDFFWSDKYSPNLFARGFEAKDQMEDVGMLTAFEVIEHTLNPLEFIRQSMEQYKCKTMILSTVLYVKINKPPDRSWWYYSLSTGQHISFLHKKTFQKIAEILNLNYYFIFGLHVLTNKDMAVNRFTNISLKLLLIPVILLMLKRNTSRIISDKLSISR
jgi:hypothetical protein